MSTFDVIAKIRRQALSQPQTLRFLIEHFGFTMSYACEVINAVFGEERQPAHVPVRTVDRSR